MRSNRESRLISVFSGKAPPARHLQTIPGPHRSAHAVTSFQHIRHRHGRQAVIQAGEPPPCTFSNPVVSLR